MERTRVWLGARLTISSTKSEGLCVLRILHDVLLQPLCVAVEFMYLVVMMEMKDYLASKSTTPTTINGQFFRANFSSPVKRSSCCRRTFHICFWGWLVRRIQPGGLPVQYWNPWADILLKDEQGPRPIKFQNQIFTIGSNFYDGEKLDLR